MRRWRNFRLGAPRGNLVAVREAVARTTTGFVTWITAGMCGEPQSTR